MVLFDNKSDTASDGAPLWGAIRTASGERLREEVPFQVWLSLGVYLVGLEQGVLKVATLHDLSMKQEDMLLDGLARYGFAAEDIETELWDRAELQLTLRACFEALVDSCEKMLLRWIMDRKNERLCQGFARNVLAESVRMKADEIVLTIGGEKTGKQDCAIKYRIASRLVPMYLLPMDCMQAVLGVIAEEADERGLFHFSWQGRRVDVHCTQVGDTASGVQVTLVLSSPSQWPDMGAIFARYPEIHTRLQDILADKNSGLLLLAGQDAQDNRKIFSTIMIEQAAKQKKAAMVEAPILCDLPGDVLQIDVGEGVFEHALAQAFAAKPDHVAVGVPLDMNTLEPVFDRLEDGRLILAHIQAKDVKQALEKVGVFMPDSKHKPLSYVFAHQLKAVIQTELVPTLCRNCADDAVAGDVVGGQSCIKLGLERKEKVRIRNERGCDLCQHTGYVGGVHLVEAMFVADDDETRTRFHDEFMKKEYHFSANRGVKIHSKANSLRVILRQGLVDPTEALERIEKIQ